MPSEELALSGVEVTFGSVVALSNLDLELRRGEVLGVIGPNGAGKTTLINVMGGVQRPTRGKVLLDGRDVTSWQPHRRARNGIARTFQGLRAFRALTVRENIEAAAISTGASWKVARSRSAALIDLIGLDGYGDVRAGALPHGHERRLGIARAAAGDPDFLILDEPAAGLDETEGGELVGLIRTLRAELSCGVLLVEHDMAVIMSVCDRLHVLNFGRTISTGDPKRVRHDPAVLEAYLGTRHGEAMSGAEDQ